MTTARQSAPGNADAERDTAMMRRALVLAKRGWGRVSPNPLVGAVIVKDGRIVGEGWHAEYGQDHAEVAAIRDAGEAARDGTMYVSLEPCSHHGKTPPCTGAIIEAGIAEVVIGCDDPNPRARGGRQVLEAAGIPVRSGVEEESARSLNAAFMSAQRADSARPWIELKLALSLDGRMADGQGHSSWITGPEARAEVHRMRAGHDAIAVGIGTVLADDPQLTVRDAPAPRIAPTRVVFDRRLRTPADGRLLHSLDQAPVVIVTSPDAPSSGVEALRDRGAEVISAAGIEDGLRLLREREIRSLFCEGGATIASVLLRSGAVDRLSLFVAPVLLGGEGADPFAGLPAHPIADAPRWRPVRQAAFGADTLISVER